MSDGQHRRILGRLGRERGFGALCECCWSVDERAVARGGYRAKGERGRTDEAQLGHATRSPGWWSLERVDARMIAAFSLETTPIGSSHGHESATERTEPCRSIEGRARWISIRGRIDSRCRRRHVSIRMRMENRWA